MSFRVAFAGALSEGPTCRANRPAAPHGGVAGPHGAAFSLLCLGRLPLSVIELHSPHYHAACFRHATTALGGRYAAVNARPGLFQPPHSKANFSLDVSAVAAWLVTGFYLIVTIVMILWRWFYLAPITTADLAAEIAVIQHQLDEEVLPRLRGM